MGMLEPFPPHFGKVDIRFYQRPERPAVEAYFTVGIDFNVFVTLLCVILLQVLTKLPYHVWVCGHFGRLFGSQVTDGIDLLFQL